MSVVGVLWVYIRTYVHECGGGFVGAVRTYVYTGVDILYMSGGGVVDTYNYECGGVWV